MALLYSVEQLIPKEVFASEVGPTRREEFPTFTVVNLHTVHSATAALALDTSRRHSADIGQDTNSATPLDIDNTTPRSELLHRDHCRPDVHTAGKHTTDTATGSAGINCPGSTLQ